MGTESRPTNRTGSPERAAQAAAGIAKPGSSEVARTMWSGAEFGEPVPQLLDRGRQLGRAGALDVSDPQVARGRDLADRERLRVAGLRRALGPERDERRRGDVGDVVGVGDQDRSADRVAHQHRGGDPGGPVVGRHEADRRRALEPALRRIGRERRAGGDAAESMPPIRVVFLVANAGKPSCCAAIARCCSPERGDLRRRRLRALVVAQRPQAEEDPRGERERAEHGGGDPGPATRRRREHGAGTLVEPAVRRAGPRAGVDSCVAASAGG